MNAQAQEVSSNLDVLKYILALVLVSAGVVGFYQLSDSLQLYRVLLVVVAVVMALAVMMATAIGQKAWVFAQESKQEVRKVVWPTRSETMQTTLMVFAMVVIVGLILWLLDMFLFWAISSLTI